MRKGPAHASRAGEQILSYEDNRQPLGLCGSGIASAIARAHAQACAGARRNLNCHMITKLPSGNRAVLSGFRAPTGYVPRPGAKPFLIHPDKDSEVQGGISLTATLKDGTICLYQYGFWPVGPVLDLLAATLNRLYSYPCSQPAGGYCFNATVRPQLYNKFVG